MISVFYKSAQNTLNLLPSVVGGVPHDDVEPISPHKEVVHIFSNEAKKLVKMLHQSDVDVQTKAAKALRSWTYHNSEYADIVVKRGGMQPLAKLLSSSSVEAKAQALGALSNLAHNEDNQVLLVKEAEVLPPVIKILYNDHDEVLVNAVTLIACLASNEAIKELIVNEYGLPPLVHLLYSDNQEVLSYTTAALANLTTRSDIAQDPILQKEALQPLIRLFYSGSTTTVVNSASILRSLAYQNIENKEAIGEECLELVGQTLSEQPSPRERIIKHNRAHQHKQAVLLRESLTGNQVILQENGELPPLTADEGENLYKLLSMI